MRSGRRVLHGHVHAGIRLSALAHKSSLRAATGNAVTTGLPPPWFRAVISCWSWAVALFAASQYFSPIILRDIIESPQVYGATVDYLHWRTYGIFFSFLCVMFRAYYVGITQTKILTVNSIVMLLSNVALNYCLIFGKGGFPRRRHSRGGHCLQRIGSSLPSLFHHLHKHDGG